MSQFTPARSSSQPLSIRTNGPSATGYQDSPTQLRLSVLESRIAQNLERRANSPPRARTAMENTKSVPLSPEDSSPDGPNASFYEAIENQDQRIDTNEQRIEELKRSFDRLTMEMESEEFKRQNMNSTFAKNFALKIEERFLKIEAELNSRDRAVTDAEAQRVALTKDIDSTFEAFEARLTALAEKVDASEASVASRWGDFDQRVEALAKTLAETKEAASSRESGLWGKISEQLDAMRDQLAEDRMRQASIDDQRGELVEQGISFVKEGQEQWQRMFDYKLAPFKQTREEAEARFFAKADGVAADVASIKASVVEISSGNKLGELKEEVNALSEQVAVERGERARTEEQVSQLLEMLVDRDEEALLERENGQF
ncbi:Chromosome partition protein Smc [Carpediemonas membranifera]|uniref:Chromosome partition protein Smc n=1 Tax=Carpediemonas membranifera TaxID=201153 RepID=A0A8J6E6T6_9EUKA|nr:Chromosome partition protein Smc [Carpediemonas membranifera]|eukprot:KAG9397492.1 Chromosome partition protein Smc [Carpediemonas membranifera]